MSVFTSWFKPSRFIQKQGGQISVSPQLIESAKSEVADVLAKLETTRDGLTQEEAEKRLRERGSNVVAIEKQATWLQILLKAMLNPLVILLLVLATVTFANAQETS